ncbi:hypothetical protein KIW84_012626 [Lathyrus oleraceus]|uniref:Uncharacterized protein n=1 Tax=Pisum sativum TaxID=3888 RepID=A0A9D5BIC9_PEA|nr:hypothetical protein KIW84_012626 [Pisum sativum]
MHQDGGGSSSGGSQEMATSGAKKRQASPPILDVNKLMSKRRLVNMQKMMMRGTIRPGHGISWWIFSSTKIQECTIFQA